MEERRWLEVSRILLSVTYNPPKNEKRAQEVEIRKMRLMLYCTQDIIRGGGTFSEEICFYISSMHK
jgi:hypothetical protein